MYLLKILFLILALTSQLIAQDFKEIDQFSKIKIEFTKRCMFGDFDAIDYDLQYDLKPKLIVSLIGLSSGREQTQEIFKDIYAGVSENLAGVAQAQLYKNKAEAKQKIILSGINLNLEIPKEDFAILICKDSSGTASCLKKETKDLNKILAEYQEAVEPHEVPDHVYFYQVLKFNEDKYLTLNKVIGEKDIPSLVNSGISGIHAKGLSTIQSLELQSKSGNLIVQLPYFDKVKCGQ